MDELDKKVYDVFSGRVVKKGATKLVKGASNVPTYVLEYLLGTYCTSDDDKEIETCKKKSRKKQEVFLRNFASKKCMTKSRSGER